MEESQVYVHLTSMLLKIIIIFLLSGLIFEISLILLDFATSGVRSIV